ncbi:ubiquitin fusion degradation 1 protein [Anaeramoeba flamelloides]|uniref:Ubiquitin fusion degradation 1 protein n=1 Tax=Anaeramoeba flamelloides TaxID=1746091 RepID=A0ABQ8XK05_9EUKA|nr:ubiquitin fusion degradation 1 protein [Anaeramoeba flamelloides]
MSRRFIQTYHCISAQQIARQDVDKGGKICLPESALSALIQNQVETPYMFEIKNLSNQTISHCGVLDFNAVEGTCVLPTWLMNTLELQNRGRVQIIAQKLPLGSYIKFQPLTSDFTSKVTNPKVVLERQLRNFACLTQGDIIEIKYLNLVFYISVLETKPGKAINIIRTDCNVEFAPPRDQKQLTKEEIQKELERMQKVKNKSTKLSASSSSDDETPSSSEEKNKPKFKPFEGSGSRIDGKRNKEKPKSNTKNNSESSNNSKTNNQKEKNKPKFKVFEGSGSRIDGKKNKKSQQQKVTKEKKETIETPKKISKFKPFRGSGNRVDNKPIKKSITIDSSSSSSEEDPNEKKIKRFGRNNIIQNKEEEKPKFVPFSSEGTKLSQKK